MRSFGKSKSYKSNYESNTYQRRKEYSTRVSNEWDLRLDVLTEVGAQAVTAKAIENLDQFTFIMVSGMETPDSATIYPNPRHEREPRLSAVSQELHVHIGLITNRPLTRQQAIDLVRPDGVATTPGSVYAVPRNTKFPYTGWICHHSKMTTKMKDQPGLRLEHGTLPLDAFDMDTLTSVDRMIRKFGNEDMKHRFEFYQDALRTLKEMEAVPAIDENYNVPKN